MPSPWRRKSRNTAERPVAMTAVSDHAPCAVVVTYQPELPVLAALLEQLNAQCDFVVIDNGSTASDRVAAITEGLTRCGGLIRRGRNEGLARALNIGILWARDRGHDPLFLFDQDSQPGADFIARMLAARDEIEARCARPVAAIGPRLVDPRNGRRTAFKVFNRLWRRSDRPLAGAARHYQADFLITSGCLLNGAHLDAIGPMKEGYFIDNVDLEWCFRARARGFELAGTDAAELFHVIGEHSDNPLVSAGLMAQHSPERSYYSSRNRRHLWHCDYAPLGWKLRDRVRFGLKAGWLLLTSPRRRQYWHNIRNGLRDAGTLS